MMLRRQDLTRYQAYIAPKNVLCKEKDAIYKVVCYRVSSSHLFVILIVSDLQPRKCQISNPLRD